MKGFLLGASLSLAFILGCVARPLVVPAVSADAVATEGPHAGHRECAALVIPGTNNADWISQHGQPKADRVVPVPAGWTAVGGGKGGGNGYYFAVICR